MTNATQEDPDIFFLLQNKAGCDITLVLTIFNE